MVSKQMSWKAAREASSLWTDFPPAWVQEDPAPSLRCDVKWVYQDLAETGLRKGVGDVESPWYSSGEKPGFYSLGR